MNKKRLAISILSCLLFGTLFSGCLIIHAPSQSRSNLNPETISKIIPGKTTRDQILSMLGQPDEVSINGNRFTYVRKYELALIIPGKKLDQPNRYILIIDFDEQGTVSARNFIEPYEYHDRPIHGIPPVTSHPSEHMEEIWR